MPAPKGNQYAIGNSGGGRPPKYKRAFAKIAKKLCELGATDSELADAFEVGVRTIRAWKTQHKEFSASLKPGKAVANDRVEQSLYHRALGYSYDAVKIFMPKGSNEPVYAPYREHVPPDSTAIIFWLKNRKSKEWRDKQEFNHTGDMKLSLNGHDVDL